MKLLQRSAQGVSLREAAGTIFALSAILPLLVLFFLLWRYQLIAKTEARVGLLLALLIAILGFVLFLRLVDRLSKVAQGVGVPRLDDRASGGVEEMAVPGFGTVTEIGQITAAFSRLFEELRASTERLEDLVFKLGTLSEMVEVTSRIPDIQDLLGLVLERSMRNVGAAVGSIMLLDQERQTLRIAAAVGLPEQIITGTQVSIGQGLAGEVAQFGEPILIDDIETDSRFAKADGQMYGSGSFICMPVRVGDRVIGVINLAKKKYGAVSPSGSRPFSPTDLKFLSALVTYIAYALDNARLLEETRQSAKRLQDVVKDQQLRLTLAERQMLQAAKLSAMGQLVAGVAHELNNPLTVLLNAAHFLRDQAPEHLREWLARMSEAAERASRIVQGLLTFARRLPLERQRVNLATLLENVLAVTEADLRLARVTVERDVDPNLPTLWADGGQLHQVLINLITNAKQAMEEVKGKRVLHIAMKHVRPDHVRILVEDAGPGIPADLLPTVFDPFVTTKGVHGTGLGLSISYGIIQEHGGQLSVESTVGRGTTFTIDLPVGTPEAIPVEAPVAPSLPLGGKRILVVEDDQSVGGLVRTCLEAAGCSATVVPSAEEALKQLAEAVDLVISDLYLPGMDGLAFYREATARQPSLSGRFLLMTGGIITETIERFVAETKTRLLQKPFSRQALLDSTRELLGPVS